MNLPRGKEKAEDETGQKVLVGDVSWMMSLPGASPLLRQQCHTQHVSEQPPSPSKGHGCGSTWQGKCPCPCPRCVCFGVGKANETSQQRSRGQMAASMAGAGLGCLASLESQQDSRDRGKSVAWTTPINTPREKSGQKPARDVARKAEEEVMQVKKQD